MEEAKALLSTTGFESCLYYCMITAKYNNLRLTMLECTRRITFALLAYLMAESD